MHQENKKSDVTLRELIGFSQSFMPPEEALLQFRQAYAGVNQIFDLDVAASQFDIDVAEEIITRSVWEYGVAIPVYR
jgi:iron-sulfur cluster repair protein YtfE (RIC family)